MGETVSARDTRVVVCKKEKQKELKTHENNVITVRSHRRERVEIKRATVK